MPKLTTFCRMFSIARTLERVKNSLSFAQIRITGPIKPATTPQFPRQDTHE